MQVPDDMTDERWQEIAAPIAPGWTAGRVECGGEEGPAFGWVKGNFGVYEGHGDTNIGRLELSSLTHLRSGMRVALFAMPDAAATAAELAERVGDWSEIDKSGVTNDLWKRRAKDMYALWQSAGLQCGPIVTIPTSKGVWCALEPTKRQ